MLNRRVSHIAALALTLSVAPLLLGCGGDEDNGNGGTGPSASAFVGTWSATSFIVDGNDVVTTGTSITFTFTESTYSFTIGNDIGSIFCDPGILACGDNGDIASTETTITFDPGTSEAETINYAVVGDLLTISATIDGLPVTAAFQKQ